MFFFKQIHKTLFKCRQHWNFVLKFCRNLPQYGHESLGLGAGFYFPHQQYLHFPGSIISMRSSSTRLNGRVFTISLTALYTTRIASIYLSTTTSANKGGTRWAVDYSIPDAIISRTSQRVTNSWVRYSDTWARSRSISSTPSSILVSSSTL